MIKWHGEVHELKYDIVDNIFENSWNSIIYET